jgi:hypothetical protein
MIEKRIYSIGMQANERVSASPIWGKSGNWEQKKKPQSSF